jgi:hypothetical protein
MSFPGQFASWGRVCPKSPRSRLDSHGAAPREKLDRRTTWRAALPDLRQGRTPEAQRQHAAPPGPPRLDEDRDQPRVQVSQRQPGAMNAQVSKAALAISAQLGRQIDAGETRLVVADRPGRFLGSRRRRPSILTQPVYAPREFEDIIAPGGIRRIHHTAVVGMPSRDIGREKRPGEMAEHHATVVAENHAIVLGHRSIPIAIGLRVPQGDPWLARAAAFPQRLALIAKLPQWHAPFRG